MSTQQSNRVQAIQELRRSNAATSIPSGRVYSRSSKYATIYEDDYDCNRCGIFVPCERHAYV